MVNIVRAILGLDEEDGKEIAKAVKTLNKKEKKAKVTKPKSVEKKTSSIKPILTRGEKVKSEVELDAE